MYGRQAFVSVGERIIQLIRQKIMFKYGSHTCVEKEQRKITEWEDMERCFQSKINIDRFTDYHKDGPLPLDERIKVLNEIQSGNTMEIGVLTFQILLNVVLIGTNIEMHTYKSPNNRPHVFCSVTPTNAFDNEQTIALDAWPSNQILKAEVIPLPEHFSYDELISSQLMHEKKSPDFQFKRFKSFEDFSIHDFNIKELERIERLVESKEVSKNQAWRSLRNRNPGLDIYDMMNMEELWATFRADRWDAKNVRKPKLVAKNDST